MISKRRVWGAGAGRGETQRKEKPPLFSSLSLKSWLLWDCSSWCTLDPPLGLVVVGLGWQPSAQQDTLSLPFSAAWWGQNKMKKELVGQDESSLIKKQQRSYMEAKMNKWFYSLLPIGRLVITSHFLASTALVLQKTNAAFTAEQVPSWYGISLCSGWISCFGCASSQTLAHASAYCPLERGQFGKTALVLCQHCTAVAKHWYVTNTFPAPAHTTAKWGLP